MFRLRSYICTLLIFVVAYSDLFGESFTITVAHTNVTCKADDDGTGTVTTIVGGIAPFTYSWKDINSIEIGTDITITDLAPGDYFVTVRDFEGDEEIGMINVKDWFIFIIGVSESDVTCFGDNNGSISYNALGLHGGLIFSVDSGYNYQASNSFSDLVPDDYYIFVQDEKGCIKVHDSNPISITEPLALSIAVEAATSKLSLTCFGNTDGSIDITPDEGTPPYTYAWTGPGTSETTQDIGSLGVGEYFVTVTDANLCDEYDSVTIDSPPELIIQIISDNDVSCFGKYDGSIDVTVIGGDPKAGPPYDYAWTRDSVGGVISTSEDLSSLGPDNYYLEVTDEVGCVENSGAIAISEPFAISVSNDDTVHVSCFGDSTGAISISISGGTAPYTPEWSGPDGFTSSNQDITGLKAGAYSLLVTDASGCTYNHPAITITQPTAIDIDIEITSNLDLSCFADTNGSIYIGVSGGTPEYTFAWTGPSFSETSEDILSLAGGDYMLEVTDSINCKAYDTVTITEPTKINIQIDAANDISCFGSGDGSIGVTVTEGTRKVPDPPYDYLWTSDLGPTFNTEDLSGLEADNYYLKVTDDNGCSDSTAAIVIAEPDSISLKTDSTVNILCNGESTGAIYVDISGGNSPYIKSWTEAGGFTSSSEDITGIPAGDYSLTVTDAIGCTDSIPSTVISEPDSISASIHLSSKLQLACYDYTDGKINITVTGGVNPLSYSWTGPNSYKDSINKNIAGLKAGDYNLVITDANVCTKSYTPFATIIEPPKLLLTLEKVSISCFGDNDGSIIAHATGGTPDYLFSQTATTASWEPDSLFSGLTSGGYIVFVKDQNECQTYDTVVLDQPPSLYIASKKVDSANICYGDNMGEIIINAGGGTPPLRFSIDSGATDTTYHIFSNLPAGEYKTLVTDARGCTKPGYEHYIDQPDPLLTDTTIIDDITNCSYDNDGRIYIKVSGGAGGIMNYTLDSVSSTIFGIFENLAAGSHLIQIEDELGCVKDTSLTVTAPPPLVYDSISITDVSGCFGDASGEIFVRGTGGSGSLQYSLDLGALKDTGQWVSQIAGDYTVRIQDSLSCTLDTLLSISQPDTLGYSDLTVTPIACRNDDNGVISITGSGGNPPYNYTLMPGSVINTTGLFDSLSPGGYTVEISGSGICPDYITNTITFTDPPFLSLDSTNYSDISCQGANNGSIEIFAKGGVSPINYSVDTGSNYVLTDIFSNLPPATYITVIQDANACVIRGDTIVFTDPPSIQITNLSSTDIKCYGDSSGSISITTTGGTAPLEYTYDSISWQTSGTFSAVPAGSYRVYIRDANSCADSSNSLTISQGPEILADITTVKSLNGQPGSLHISSSGGVGNHQYSLDSIGNKIRNFQSDTFFTQIWPEIYDVIVRDDSTCTLTKSILLEATPPLDIGISQTDNTCFGDSAGSIRLSSLNGTGVVQFSIDGGNTLGTDSVFTNLISKKYYIYVLDEDKRIFRDTIELGQPAEILIVLDTVINIKCTGDKDGSIQTRVTSDNRPVIYSWTSMGGYLSSDSVLTDLDADKYELKVTDATGCSTRSDSIEITEPLSLGITPDSSENISCYGNQDGAIYMTVNGGSSPYNVLWTGPDIYQSSNWDIVDLDSGNYQVVVADQNGCTANYGPVYISEPDTLALTIEGTSILSIDCAGSNDGKIDISVSGGTPSYSYLWSGPNGFTSLQEDIASLGGGDYRLIVIDGNSCNASTGSISISEPEAIAVVQSITLATCYSSSFDGSITLSVNGGLAPYTYLWSNNATSKDITGLDAGNYSVTITDANDCVVSNNFFVNSTSSVRANAGKDTAVCPGERLILGGQGGDFYLWQPETGLSNPNIPNPVATLTDDSIQYILTVSDPLCVDFDTIVLKQHPQANIDAGEDTTITIGQIIQLQTTGGSFESYSWLPESGLDDPGSAAPMLTVIGTFTYYITATDSNGCSAMDSIYIEVPHGLVIYSGFTPNGDGVNDYWDIDNTGSYPGIIVEVYNRWGKQIFSSVGYFDEDRWDGTYNGKEVPTGTYYYVIIRGEGLPPITGTITIVR